MSNPHRSKPVPASDVEVVAESPSVSAAARRLGVNRSTVHRWVTAGKAPKPGRRRVAAAAAGRVKTPEGWRRWIARTYELNGHEQVLADAAVRALEIAHDERQPPITRLTALGRFQALTKQLNFDGAADATQTDASIHAAARRRA